MGINNLSDHDSGSASSRVTLPTNKTTLPFGRQPRITTKREYASLLGQYTPSGACHRAAQVMPSGFASSSGNSPLILMFPPLLTNPVLGRIILLPPSVSTAATPPQGGVSVTRGTISAIPYVMPSRHMAARSRTLDTRQLCGNACTANCQAQPRLCRTQSNIRHRASRECPRYHNVDNDLCRKLGSPSLSTPLTPLGTLYGQRVSPQKLGD